MVHQREAGGVGGALGGGGEQLLTPSEWENEKELGAKDTQGRTDL